MNQNILSGAQFQIFDALHDAGKRLGERGIAEIRFRFQPQQIFLDEPRGNDDGFRVGAVEEQQIFAEIFLTGSAVESIRRTARNWPRQRGRRFAILIPNFGLSSRLTSEMTPASSWPKTAGGTIIFA